MRRLLKQVITWILLRRSRAEIQKQNALVILIVGALHRTLYKNQIVETLEKQGREVLANRCGNNYFLGLPSTILGIDLGVHSAAKWVQNVFTRKRLSLPTYIVLEFAYGREGDYSKILKYVDPNVIIISDTTFPPHSTFTDQKVYESQLNTLIGLSQASRIYTPVELAIPHSSFTFGTEEGVDIRLIERSESTNGQSFSCSIQGEHRSETLNNFGEQYIFAHCIAKDLLINV